MAGSYHLLPLMKWAIGFCSIGKNETYKMPMPSKFPGFYRIDLHIDDDVSVAQNGRTFGFEVFLVGEQDDEWDDKIMREIEKKYHAQITKEKH